MMKSASMKNISIKNTLTSLVLVFCFVTPVFAQTATSDPSDNALSSMSPDDLRKRAEQGDPDAQIVLGLAYLSGHGVAPDEAQGWTWFCKPARQGNKKSYAKYGNRYAQGFTEKLLELKCSAAAQDDAQDKKNPLRDLRERAERGDAEAQYELGRSYASGEFGLKRDRAQAAAWYRKAAEQGNTDAQFWLGILYDRPDDDGNDALAVAWYRKAAERGDSRAQYYLGTKYIQGRGVEKNDAQALAWFRKAAEQGDFQAERALIEMKRRGMIK
jgi:TPR repeat protein